MTDPTYPWRPLEYGFPPHPVTAFAPPRRRLWLHLLLFGLTILTTLAVGARLDYDYTHNLPAFDLDRSLNPFAVVWGNPGALLHGVAFSFTLLGILLAHEMGHYLTCRYYGIQATLPYFIPAPTIIGTMGAFIRIRSPIVSRRALFDVGISGPLAGFLVALPALIYGVGLSREVPVAYSGSAIVFGDPLLFQLTEKMLHPGVTTYNVYLHPIARAAWVGLFATALNLLPIGQLDGGHIIYALFGERHRKLSRFFVLGLLPLGYYWLGWVLWATVLFFIGMRHPAIWDPIPLDRGRRSLAVAALAIFILCFTPSPFTVT